MRFQGILNVLCLPPGLHRKFGLFVVTGELSKAEAAVPKQHAATVKGPDGLLRGCEHALAIDHGGFLAREEKSILKYTVSTTEKTPISRIRLHCLVDTGKGREARCETQHSAPCARPPEKEQPNRADESLHAQFLPLSKSSPIGCYSPMWETFGPNRGAGNGRAVRNNSARRL